MKKSALPAVLLLFGVGLGVTGCPVYDSDDVGCFRNQDCAAGYLCDDQSGNCYADPTVAPNACNSPDDCGKNETCGRSGTCVTGDCHFSSVGCVNGYACSSTTGRWECLAQGPANNGGAASGGASTGAGTGGEPNATDGGAPAVMSTAGAGG